LFGVEDVFFIYLILTFVYMKSSSDTEKSRFEK